MLMKKGARDRLPRARGETTFFMQAPLPQRVSRRARGGATSSIIRFFRARRKEAPYRVMPRRNPARKYGRLTDSPLLRRPTELRTSTYRITAIYIRAPLAINLAGSRKYMRGAHSPKFKPDLVAACLYSWRWRFERERCNLAE